MSQFDFIPFEGLVTVYKHKTKRMYLTIHVDDLLVIGSNDDRNWFKTELSKTFTMKCEGPDMENCLQRSWNCDRIQQTTYSQVTRTFEGRKSSRPVPHHAQLETYLAGRVLDAEKLNDTARKLFRGGSGICSDIAQDCPFCRTV